MVTHTAPSPAAIREGEEPTGTTALIAPRAGLIAPTESAAITDTGAVPPPVATTTASHRERDHEQAADRQADPAALKRRPAAQRADRVTDHHALGGRQPDQALGRC